MKNKKNSRHTAAICLCFLMAGLLSCKKFIEIPPPQVQAERKLVFENDQAALSAVTGLYSRMTQSNLEFANAGVTFYTALSSDEITYSGINASIKIFETNSLVPEENSALQDRLWNAMYKNIFHANSILEGLSASLSVSDSLRMQLRGEALVVRSLNYFYLVNLFGEVPLITATDYTYNQKAARTEAALIYRQMNEDLAEAKQLLKTAYASANRARPNKWTAAALLARVYLYQKNYAAAETESEAVINSGAYSLVANLNNVFLPASNETIWQLVRDNANPADGVNYIPSSATARPSYTISNSLLSAFQPGDLRKANWLAKNTISGQDYYYPFKYKARAATPVSEYNLVLRLAEQYLICAEAKANLDKITVATSYINMIRARAGLGNVTAANKTEMLAAIERERQTELFVEWGHRWLDLKRTGRADAVLAAMKAPNWQSTDILYPIPAYEINTNPFLVQNPGY